MKDSNMKESEPILDAARGDAAVSKQLSDALRIIARGTPDRALQQQIRDILSGNGSVRDLAQGEAFNRVLDGVIPDAMAKYHAMSEEERGRQVDEGRSELERCRRALEQTAPAEELPAQTRQHDAPNQYVISGTRKPNRDRVVAPDEPDDDDLYFQERSQRGWLT